MKKRPDVKAVVHCHPPHATAFAIAGEPIPQCVLPEVEVFMGEIPIAPYETPGGQEFADTVEAWLVENHDPVVMDHHRENFSQLSDTPERPSARSTAHTAKPRARRDSSGV